MVVWRLSLKAYADQPLSGEGARRYGGRWNHAGMPVVYTSGSLSLAVLEYLVNLSISDLPDDLVAIAIEVPDKLARVKISIADLPSNWRSFPGIEELKDLGTEWARKGKAAILAVPSVIIPNESNYLISPARDASRRVKILSVEPFSLDVRLYSTSRKAVR